MGSVLERIRFGTYRPEEIDIDALNAGFYDAMKDVPYDRASQAAAARNRMLQAWSAVDASEPDADTWIRKAGPEHYAKYLPRLHESVEAVRPLVGRRRWAATMGGGRRAVALAREKEAERP